MLESGLREGVGLGLGWALLYKYICRSSVPRLPGSSVIKLPLQWGAAIEIERAIKKSARFC